MGLFMFLDPQQMKQSYLRMLVYILPVSEIYDGIWLYQKTSEYWNWQGEGGMSQLILLLVYMMLIYKVFLFIIMWKASLNYQKFVQ